MGDAFVAIGWIVVGYAIGLIHVVHKMTEHLNLFMDTYNLAKDSYKRISIEHRETINIQRQTIREQKKLIERLLKSE